MDAATLHADTLANDGATIDLLGHSPSTGYQVSPYAKHGLIVRLADFSPELITEYISNHVEILGREDHYLGTWIDAGWVYLDISLNVQGLIEALAIGRRNRQIAIWSNEEFTAIEVI